MGLTYEGKPCKEQRDIMTRSGFEQITGWEWNYTCWRHKKTGFEISFADSNDWPEDVFMSIIIANAIQHGKVILQKQIQEALGISNECNCTGVLG